MAENKTVKYHIPHRGIYMYSHVHEGKTGKLPKLAY